MLQEMKLALPPAHFLVDDLVFCKTNHTANIGGPMMLVREDLPPKNNSEWDRIDCQVIKIIIQHRK